MKVKSLLLFIVPLLFICAGIGRWYSWNHPSISCGGQITWEIGRESFAGNLSYQLNNGVGLAILTGKLKTPERSWNISRSIYFSYTQRHNAYLLTSEKIIASAPDKLDARYIGMTLPGFYLQQGKELNLIIERYNNRWLFYASDVPSLLCTKEP